MRCVQLEGPRRKKPAAISGNFVFQSSFTSAQIIIYGVEFEVGCCSVLGNCAEAELERLEAMTSSLQTVEELVRISLEGLVILSD